MRTSDFLFTKRIRFFNKVAFLRVFVLALPLTPLLQADEGAPGGNAAAGKTAWMDRRCRRCHGEMGEGGFGPDLAGRALTYSQFKQALRKPWGIMPTFIELYTSDQVIADLQAYLISLPKVDAPAAWVVDIRNIVPNSQWSSKPPTQDAPLGQQLFASYGCIQCHGPEGTTIRQDLGAEAADNDFQHFAKIIYTHTDRYKSPRMGDFSRLRLPETALQEIYHFLFEEAGYLPLISASVKPGTSTGDNTVYTVELENRGLPGKGLTSENMTIALALPPDTKVVGGTGVGYQGVRNDSELNSQAAIWQLPSLAPKEKQTFTLTVAGSGGKPADVFKGSVVRWVKPEIRKSIPNLVLRDPQMPGKDPQTLVAFR
jgi:mono/diheme cytochrome c family protein